MPSRRTPLALAAALTASLALAACGGGESTPASSASSASASDDGLSVVTSTNVYGSVVEAVAGDAATVTSIIDDPSADPHSYEASTRTQLELSKADVVVENGGGYDDFVDTMLDAAGSGAVVLNAVELSGKTAAAGEELNEHVWYDVETVRKVAQAVEEELAKASPDDAATFEANLATFEAGLDTLQQKITADAATTQGQPVAITEPVPGYLLEALGTVNATPEEFSEAIEEETDVPVDALQETLALFTQKQVRALVHNEQTTGPQTEQVLQAAQDNGIAVVPVTETLPDGEDYTTWMTGNVDAIAAALAR
ncbi:metal ABC transporter solute-binding protein, Zn/Mn family [Kineococcus radiotolerans]|uniref:Periplasmic solute binding protein n=1 Tax=Kineococcus radiotolerans (strain ATCC BAA-149 / DSM 14245 / SRS30216) TaxID=266940 RepID=A6W4J0_KINRD|nr:zinc ABC transporter substrate-binding protein [Kineococcus radiotolerans]ABS01729.1 periplasmic solute binding protein [Kineococcus radiotolerans SRS30216 = ATCC BAA-149]